MIRWHGVFPVVTLNQTHTSATAHIRFSCGVSYCPKVSEARAGPLIHVWINKRRKTLQMFGANSPCDAREEKYHEERCKQQSRRLKPVLANGVALAEPALVSYRIAPRANVPRKQQPGAERRPALHPAPGIWKGADASVSCGICRSAICFLIHVVVENECGRGICIPDMHCGRIPVIVVRNKNCSRCFHRTALETFLIYRHDFPQFFIVESVIKVETCIIKVRSFLLIEQGLYIWRHHILMNVREKRQNDERSTFG